MLCGVKNQGILRLAREENQSQGERNQNPLCKHTCVQHKQLGLVTKMAKDAFLRSVAIRNIQCIIE